MGAKLERGDRVSWRTSQGETRGKVVRKLAGKSRIKGYTAKASKRHPQYLVESAKSGAKAAHKRSALKKS